MALDFNKARKNIEKSYDKKMGSWEKKHPKETIPQSTQTKKQIPVSNSKNKRTPSHGRHKVDADVREALNKEVQTNPIPQALTRFNEKIINNVALSPITTPYQIATGKKLVDFGLNPETKSAEVGAGVGNFLGTAVEYGMGYKAAGKAIEKGAEKLLTSAPGKKAAAKVVGSAIGKKAGKEVAENVVKGVAKNIVGDATVGTVLNLADARGRGLEGKELAEDMAINAAFDFGVGNAVEFAPMAVKALKNAKLAKQAKNINLDTLSQNAKKVAETGDFGVQNGNNTVNQTAGENLPFVSAKQEIPYRTVTPEAFEKITKAVEKRSGCKITFADLPDNIDGQYENGVITISTKAQNPVYTILKHELTHHLETSGHYKAFSDFVENTMREAGYDVEGEINKIIKAYSDNEKYLTPEQAKREFIANFSQEYLFNSEQSIERLARENPSLFRQIYDWIVDTIKKIGASAETKFLIDAERKYEKALRTVGTVDINAKSQFSIPYNANSDLKSKQLEVIKNANPMTDNYHVGIRSAADIKTFEEAMKDGESFFYGDFDITDAEKALKSGEITVYSSKPIEQGGFVSTSQNMARDYAGGGKVYSKKVKLDDVAWINGDEGQYAKATTIGGQKLVADSHGKKLTNEQQEYFKNSKVRDSEGRLMRVYHGTYDDFTTFNLDHTKNANDLGKGFYFTNKIDDAKNNYASSNGGDVQTKIEELAYELFQEKGYTEDDLYNNAYVEEYNKAYDEAEAYYNKGKTISTYLNLTNPLYASEYGHLYNSKGEEVMRTSVEEYLRQGYDGIIDTSVKEKFPNQNLEEGTTHYVVFKPEQIKSIDNINPTNNPDIRYSINSSKLGETDYTQKLRAASQNLSGTDNDGRALTEGQQKYFKNSKVRDANGNLKVMYHGTGNAGFTVFDSKYSDDGRSFFFTDNINVAKGYSASDDIFSRKHFESIESLEKHIAQEMDEEVKIRKNGKMFELWQDNDFVVRDESLDDLYWDYNEYMGFGGDSANYQVYLNLENPLVIDADKNNWDEIPVPWSDDLMTTRSIAEYANENGYDGVMINNVIDTGLYGQRFDTSNIAIAFDSNQIKNVDNANPTNDSDIRFLLRTSGLTETDYTRRLRAASENLRGEKGNKYLQTAEKIPLANTPKKQNVSYAKNAVNDLSDEEIQKEFVKNLQGSITGDTPTGKILTVMRTPDILRQYGATADTITMTQNTARKAMYPSGYLGMGTGHNLGFGGLEILPEQLRNPVAILDSFTQDNARVIITNTLDSNKNPVLVALHLDKKGRLELSDEIASVYGKREYEDFIKRAKAEGKVLYEDKKIGLDAVPSVGLQLPGANHSSDPMNMVANKVLTVNAKNVKQDNKNLKDLGADIARPQQTIAEAKKKYGAYGGKEGDIPLRTDLGRVTQGAKTVYNSPIADEEMMKAIKTGVEEGSYWTRKMSNKEALDAAAEKIKESGLDNETTSFLNLARDNREVKGEDIAMGYQLAKEHIAQGNYEAAQAVLSDVCQMESEAGRALQAMRLFNSLSPEGRVKSVMRSAEKIKKNTGVEVKVSDEMLEQLKNATAEELPAIKKQINNELWDQVPATFSEKLTAWRYLAMLGNPRTHIRNIVGNALYVPVIRIDNVIQTGLEKAMKNRLNKLGANKTTAILTNSADDKALKKIGAERFKQLKDTLDSGNGKYNEELRPLESRVFKSKLLEGAKNLNSNALEKEDQLFMELNFKSAFAQYCKANGKKAADLTDDFIEEAANHAYDVALRSTYRDPSRLADVLGSFRKRTLTPKSTNTLSEKALKTAGRVVMDSALPFTKTPINILKRGVSHSPLGLVKGMVEIATAKDGKQLVKAITQVSEGLTGTGIVALGMYMASIGMANGSLGEYNKEYKWKQLLGQQDYALNVDDYSITLDWAAPISMPFFVGVELGTKLLEEKGNVWDALESLSQIYQPVLEMSMLSGIQSLFDFSNGDSKDLVSFMGNAVQNLTSQYIPTILGQTARTAVDERKIALSTAENKLQRNAEKYIDKLENKIPGLTNTNESYVDMFGRTEKKNSAADYIETGLENFLSPAYVQKANKNKVETELERMRQVLGAEGKEILPTDYSYNYDIRYNGEDIRMTEEQFTKYKKVRGKAAYDGLEKLFDSSKYKLMSTNEKKKAIKDVYDKAAEDAKKSTVISMGIATETEYKYSLLSENAKATVDAMKKKGIPAKTAVNAYETQKAYGSGTEKALALMKKGYNNQVIKGLDISNTQIEKARALQNAGISISKLTTAKKEADTNGNGNISKEEVINYVEARSFTPQEKYALLKALTPVKDKNNPYA